ncbi:MAG: ABC transporter substrate-binding protein, partial [Campylobacterales bacterium]|nr:ABC transporter substrate-binding protein [Campylobacterales bacterium]
MKKILLTFTFLVTALFADSDEDRVTFLFIQKSDKVIDIVKNKKISKDKRNQQIVDTISPMFDFELMAKLSLGKKVWRSLNRSKKQEFIKLYVERMKKSYSSKIDSYTDEEIAIDGVKKTKNTRITLSTSL